MTQTSDFSENVGLHTEKFTTWIAQHYPALAPVSDFKRLTGGHSNISIAFTSAQGPMVLRRPPLGHVMQTAHDMSREYRMLKGLEHSSLPVPKPILHANDLTSGIDTEFFVMSMLPGFALTDAESDAKLTDDDRVALSRQLVERLADLHAVSLDHPLVAELGRPEGFRERQVSRWNRQLEASKSRPLPATEELGKRLAESAPTSAALSSVVHGDYKFNNTLVMLNQSAPAEITGILDWEMATLGDPLTDLAVLCLYWQMPEISQETKDHFESPIPVNGGYPDVDFLIEHYVRRSAELGITVPMEDFQWYMALACFKVAVIVESLHFRYQSGLSLDDESAFAGRMTEPLAQFGLQHL